MNMKLCGQFRAEIVCDRITLFAFHCHPVRKLSLVTIDEAGGEVKDLAHHTESRRRGSDIRFFASLRMTEYVAQNDSERLRMTEYVAQNDSVQVREVFIFQM